MATAVAVIIAILAVAAVLYPILSRSGRRAGPVDTHATSHLQEMLDDYSWLSPRWTELKRLARLLFSR